MIGFSAGGHLSLLAGFCETQFGDDPELADTDFKVKCVIDFCGPADFTQPEDYPVEMQRKYMLELLSGFLGAPFEGGEQLYADASPINYVNQNDDLSLIIFQGKNDELIPCAQVDRLYERCVEEKIDAVYVPVENATHSFNAFDQKKPISPSLKEITEKCIAFIKEKLI